MGQIGPRWDESGALSDQILVHLARGTPNALKYDLKNPRICPVPLGANLTHFGAKPTIPAWPPSHTVNQIHTERFRITGWAKMYEYISLRFVPFADPKRPTI